MTCQLKVAYFCLSFVTCSLNICDIVLKIPLESVCFNVFGKQASEIFEKRLQSPGFEESLKDLCIF